MLHPLLARPRRLLLYLALWAPLALLLVGLVAAGSPQSRLAAVAVSLPPAVLYAFLCLGSWHLCQAHPLPATPLPRLLTTHFPAAVLSTAVWLALLAGWGHLLTSLGIPEAGGVLARHLPLLATAGLLLYLLATAGHYALIAQLAADAAERRALQMQVAAREAELAALRAQLDPHFLFNSLHSVAALCSSDPAAARRMIEHLGDFLRANLELSGLERIPLGRELQLALSYLQIQRIRFGERLRYVHEVDEASMALEVPPLVLQPLVENAVKHGIAQLVDGGAVRIQAKRRRDTLYLIVDNPLDPDATPSRGTELGLENLRRRLAAAYGGRALLTAEARPEGFRVEVRVPLVAAAASAAPTPTTEAPPAGLPDPRR
ncbi:MAG TPA: histidine kinase [Thermoanaerobaculia bacterium]|nr:histidine kinase [Thermoanaerobaculia bacterium]